MKTHVSCDHAKYHYVARQKKHGHDQTHERRSAADWQLTMGSADAVALPCRLFFNLAPKPAIIDPTQGIHK